MQHVSEAKLEEFRGALDAERDSLEEELSTHGRMQSEAGNWQGKSESEGEEPDPNDAADNIEELVVNVPLVEELEKRHRDVVDAIARMEKGTFGLCEVCSEPIPLDRLEANPAARTCITHA